MSLRTQTSILAIGAIYCVYLAYGFGDDAMMAAFFASFFGFISGVAVTLGAWNDSL